MEINSGHTSRSPFSPPPTTRKQASFNTTKTKARDTAGGWRAPGYCGSKAKGGRKLEVRGRKRAKVPLTKQPDPAHPPAGIHDPQSSRAGRAKEVVPTCDLQRKPKQPRSTKPTPGLQRLSNTSVRVSASSGCRPRSGVLGQLVQSQQGPFSTSGVSPFKGW